MEPLPYLSRPTTLAQFSGQKHLVGPGMPIARAIEKQHLFSFILWGPPGVGKTTLARLYAQALQSDYFELSAVSTGKDDIRKILDKKSAGSKILFLDEIHRFNKAQQDFLLPFVESGELTLIGATTENPSFEIIPALLSRCQIFVLNQLSAEEITEIIKRNGFALETETTDWIVNFARGDARQALALLSTTQKLYKQISLENLHKALQTNYLRYDKKGEEHYNTISAFIKSMRASQPDAALYYLARMVEAGEDPKFIARRMVIFASEDIGLANPQALSVALDVFKAVEVIGYPECAINLSHGVCYLAQSGKNRDSYNAYFAALDEVKKYGNLPIPLSIRNAPTPLMKNLGYGKGYKKYTCESLLPEKIKGTKYLINES